MPRVGVLQAQESSYCYYTPRSACKVTQVACGLILLAGTLFAAWLFAHNLRYYTLALLGGGIFLSLPLIFCHEEIEPQMIATRAGGPPVELGPIQKKVVEASAHLFDKSQDPGAHERPKIKGVTYHSASYVHRVFELDSRPDYIFKTSLIQGDISDRLRKIERARAIIAENHLDRLYIPQAWISKVEVSTGWMSTEEVEVLVEEKCEIEKDIVDQGRDFEEREGFNETVYQLALFTILADWDDFSRNNSPAKKGDRKIAILPDLESCFAKRGAEIGLCGGETAEETVTRLSVVDGSKVSYRQTARAGLIGCIGERYFEDVRRAIVKSGRTDLIAPFEKACAERVKLLKLEGELEDFYASHKIVRPDQPLAAPKSTELTREENFVARFAIATANKKFKMHMETNPKLPAKYIRHFTLIYGTVTPEGVKMTRKLLHSTVKKLINMGLFHHISYSGKAQVRIHA